MQERVGWDGSGKLCYIMWGNWVCVHTCMLNRFSHIQFFVTLWTIAHQALLSMGFSRQEYWSGLPFPSPGDLPDPGIEHSSPEAPALQADSLPLNHWGSPHWILLSHKKEQNFAICTNMDGLEGIILSKISQRKINTVSYHLCVKTKMSFPWW